MFNESLDYLLSLDRFGIRLGLGTIQQIMALLDHPERQFKSIHVGGTNGKGSTCAFIDSVLRKAGYTVGRYTSPHLIRFNERMCVNGEEISDRELIHFTETIRAKLDEENKKRTDKLEPTFFEFTTAIAFLYFASKKIDLAVVEVGMGGRLDATNVIMPLVCVITNVSFDHMEHLGDTLLKIASEKAGIIKENAVVVTSETSTEVLDLFESECKKKNSKLLAVGRDIVAVKMFDSLEHQELQIGGLVEGRFIVRMLGDHQIDNVCCALLALFELSRFGFEIPLFLMNVGIEEARWGGRLEKVSSNPLVLVDGAHNVAGMIALATYVRDLKHRKVLVIGIANDKEIEKMVALIAPLFEEVIVSEGNFKPAPAEGVAAVVRKYNPNVRVMPQINLALDTAFGMVEAKDVIVATGSLYMIGDALALLKKKI